MSRATSAAVREAIEGAEPVTDPVDDLVARTANDLSVPFESDNLALLVELRATDRAAFERVRRSLKDVGCRVSALDEALGPPAGASDARGPRQADVLVGLAVDADVFHSPDGTAYADVMVNNHRETLCVRTKTFKGWLTRRFYEETGGAPNAEALQAVLGLVEARAQFNGPERDVYVRVARHEGRVYLDLADEHWRAVEIGPDGWNVIECPPVRFRRSKGMLPLPTPAGGGSLDELRRFLNVKDDRDFVLAVAWLLAALGGRPPYPVLVLSGEQGSAKSTFAGVLRFLLDPNTAALRALPREDRDLFIAARNAYVLTFDNVSGLAPWISDTLCRLSTGGGFAVRQLYTDEDEVLFDATRPVLLNGIEDIVTRPDLADRAILLTLDPISDRDRRPKEELMAELEAARPAILGVLLDGIVHGLRELPTVQLDSMPRMADFARWATACESALWSSGTVMTAYVWNIDDAVGNLIEADPVASALSALAADQPDWQGTATKLLGDLGGRVGDKVVNSRDWPKTARVLSGRLRRHAPVLRRIGIHVEFVKSRSRTRDRLITVRRLPEYRPDPASTASASSNAAPIPAEEGAEGGLITEIRVPADAADAADADWTVYSARLRPKGSR